MSVRKPAEDAASAPVLEGFATAFVVAYNLSSMNSSVRSLVSMIT